jgi:hypothetical protein
VIFLNTLNRASPDSRRSWRGQFTPTNDAYRTERGLIPEIAFNLLNRISPMSRIKTSATQTTQVACRSGRDSA